MSRTPGLCSTMINTYQTSLAPPPVPPRLNRSHPVLIPAPVTSRSYSKSLIRFMVGVVMLHLVLSVVGFIFLYNKGRIMGNYQTEGPKGQTPGIVDFFPPEKLQTSNRIMARMMVKEPSSNLQSKSGYLKWDTKSSHLSNGVNYYLESWLTIMEPGDYYVYSRVTFSRSNSTTPLANRIKLRKSKSETEKQTKTIMQAFCHLDTSKVSDMCTAMQGDVISLKKGNQLSVWVDDLSLVDYEEGATTFGLYSL
ncbi:CD40 ligand [Sphaeramia orbicularis]|uniref:Tumor necrosis factor ligand superfamily member 15-like n=1 Tax=Sphaeramia orbicularis TaxID=375764 RepID=A0A672YPH3_9TELE|nr:tumor necrosis factor ligand superfamily member 15-like [Sphaeramia orbicularis]